MLFPFIWLVPSGTFIRHIQYKESCNYLAMNLIKTGGPLFLFISLILVLGISAYFGKSASLETEGYVSRDGIPDDDYPTFSKNKNNRLTNSPGPVQGTGPAKGTVQVPAQGQTNPISDYYRWLSFWDTVANSNDPQAAFQASNYVQKTRVVPPVCPVCPSCRGGMCTGVCPNCGGNGGSGTQGASGHGFDDYNSYYGGGGRGLPLTNLANNAGAGAVDVTKTVVNDAALLVGGAGIAATGLAAGAGYGAYKLANNAGGAVERGVKGAAGMAKDTVVGGVDLAKDAVGGTVDLAKDAGKGVAGLLKSNPTQVNNINTSGGQSGGNSPGQNNGANGAVNSNVNGGPLSNQSTSFIDPYSYNGALGNKGPSNYIPITTDFSAFGK